MSNGIEIGLVLATVERNMDLDIHKTEKKRKFPSKFNMLWSELFVYAKR